MKNEFLRRLNQSHTDILETFTVLIDSAAWNIVNHSSISPMIKRLHTRSTDEQSQKMSDAAHHLLSLMAKECAPMFKSHADELVIVIGEKKNEQLVEVGLQALAAVVKVNADWGPSDRSVPYSKRRWSPLDGGQESGGQSDQACSGRDPPASEIRDTLHLLLVFQRAGEWSPQCTCRWVPGTYPLNLTRTS